MDDQALINEYRKSGSEAAFAALVQRHIDTVYAACLRQMHDAHLAEDATQAVFVILAKKAATLTEVVVLPAWLVKVAYFVCSNLRSQEQQRRAREARVAAMLPKAEEPREPSWEHASPLLDAGLAALGPRDRAALTLKFLQAKPLPEVAAAMNLSEPAAEKRISRALVKLRKFYRRRGMTFSVALLAAVLGDHAVQAAPPALAGTVVGLVMSVSRGAALPAGTLVLTQGALHMMRMAQLKAALAAGLAAAVILGAGVWAAHHAWANAPARMADVEVSADPMPAGAKGFAGMVRGNVVGKKDGGVILAITEITKTWKHSKATEAKALVGKNILVVPPTEGARVEEVTTYLNSLKVGDNINVDVAHKDGDKLTLLELTKEQREKLPKK